MFRGKREMVARALWWSGVATAAKALPAKDTLLILTYHRIGNSADDLFDPDVFSATEADLYEQVHYLRRYGDLVTLEEASDFVLGNVKEPRTRCRVLITFDDGYLDNYSTAFPVLRTLGVQGVFFLPTSFVGSSAVPWWDHVAFILKTARRRRFTLGFPVPLTVDLDAEGFTAASRRVLHLFKMAANNDPDRFLAELNDVAKGDAVPVSNRRFLSWEEAAEMVRGGMAIGSHTHLHSVLSQLNTDEQQKELTVSRTILREKLGIPADAIAYPVGGESCFSDQTKDLARASGYRLAFSFYGGTNSAGCVALRAVWFRIVYEAER